MPATSDIHVTYQRHPCGWFEYAPPHHIDAAINLVYFKAANLLVPVVLPDGIVFPAGAKMTHISFDYVKFVFWFFTANETAHGPLPPSLCPPPPC